jgi:hypothetical protein
MQYFINRILIFIFSIIILIGLVIVFTNIKINNSSIFNLPKNIKYIILGHSHPEVAFNDSLISHSKNLAQSGELYFYTYLKTKKILSENKQIKIVFLEFTNNEIINDMEKWISSEEQILYRIPKYASLMNEEDYKYIIPKNPVAFIKSLPIVFRKNINTTIYKYNDYISTYDWGKYFYNKRQHLDSLLASKKQRTVKNNFSEFNNTNLIYLNKIINLCNTNKVKIYLIRSPFYKEEAVYLANEINFRSILKSKYFNQTFLDFKDFPLLHEDYGDLDHLNYKGARKFSLFFNDLIKHGLLEKNNKQEFINQEMQKCQIR